MSFGKMSILPFRPIIDEALGLGDALNLQDTRFAALSEDEYLV